MTPITLVIALMEAWQFVRPATVVLQGSAIFYNFTRNIAINCVMSPGSTQDADVHVLSCVDVRKHTRRYVFVLVLRITATIW